MSELLTPLVEQELLEVSQTRNLMVPRQDGFGGNGLFAASGLISQQAYGIISFEGNSPRINASMTIGASLLFSMKGKLFTNGKFFKVWHACFKTRDVGRRRVGGIVEESVPNPDRPLDRVRVRSVRPGEVGGGMTEQTTRSVGALERDALEPLGFWAAQSVVFG